MPDVKETLGKLANLAWVYKITGNVNTNQYESVIAAVEIIDGYQKMEADFKKYIQSQVKRQCGPHGCYMCKHRYPDPDTFCGSETCEDDSDWEYGEPENG